MDIGIFGSGSVGRTIGAKLVTLGHRVKMGSRAANNEKAAAWVAQTGAGASQGTFADAAGLGEILFNCTAGVGSLDALQAAGAANMRGKILIDIANPLDCSKGMPPRLAIFGDDSLGERIQRAFPDVKVVKTLNTVNAQVMIDPARVPGDHDLFMSGNDAGAKQRVAELLRQWFGWRRIIDLGDISTARGTESYLLLWLRLWSTLKTADLNIKVVSAA